MSNDNILTFPDGGKYQSFVAVISAVLDPQNRTYDVSLHGSRDDLISLLRLIIQELADRGS